MSHPLLLAILACGTGIGGMYVAGLFAGVGLVFFGLTYGISRIWCRPRIARRCAYAVAILIVLALIPPYRTAHTKAIRASAHCSLKQIGLALAQYADDHQQLLPDTLEDKELEKYLGSKRILIDPETNEPFVYIGAGMVFQSTNATDCVLAYSPRDVGGRNVLFADAHVEWLTSQAFTNTLKASGQL